jgi:hypothetical protein
MQCRLCSDAITLMHSITGPDRGLLRPIHEALNQAVAMAVCSWVVNGTMLDDLSEVVSAIHGDMHQVIRAHSAEILTLAGASEARLRAAGRHEPADMIAHLIESMREALAQEPSAAGTEG